MFCPKQHTHTDSYTQTPARARAHIPTDTYAHTQPSVPLRWMWTFHKNVIFLGNKSVLFGPTIRLRGSDSNIGQATHSRTVRITTLNRTLKWDFPISRIIAAKWVLKARQLQVSQCSVCRSKTTTTTTASSVGIWLSAFFYLYDAESESDW